MILSPETLAFLVAAALMAGCIDAMAGGGGLDWLELGVLWGAITPRAGRELERGGRQGSRVSHRILVRAAPVGASTRPRADQRFRENGRTFRIRAVTEADARGRFLTCWADEETSA